MPNTLKELLKDRLYSLFNDTVRIEIGPQIVEVNCEDKSLQSTKDKPRWDAMGKPIKFGEKMSIVDHRAKFKPRLWKVYQLQEVNDRDEPRFIKVNELPEFAGALSFAEGLGGE